MIFDLTGMVIKRDASNTDFSDLTTTSGAVRTGPSYLEELPEGDNRQLVNIPFEPEADESERWPITRRLITRDAEEEALYKDVENALVSSEATRTTGVLGQTATQADSLEDTATATQANLRLAFTGVKNVAQVLQVVMQRQEWLGEQILRIINRMP